MNEINPNDIRMQAMNLLARREHLRAELYHKLRKRFGAEAEVEIDAELDHLAGENLLSDERFAESYIRQRSGKGYGPDRIRQELRQKGLDGGLLEIAMEDAEVDWVAIAREVRLKKFGPAQPGDFKEKARQLRFLNYRGFGGEFASTALDSEEESAL